MSLLSHNDLVELAARGVITNIKEGAINSASIDLHLGDTILVEPCQINGVADVPYLEEVSLARRDRINYRRWQFGMDGHQYKLYPGEFILAQTEEMFFLPNNISGEYKLKSSMARIGLEHLNAGWADAGWNSSVLTLELKNMTRNHVIVLERGVGIGQMVFFSHTAVPDDRSYAARGRYNGDASVTGIKE